MSQITPRGVDLILTFAPDVISTASAMSSWEIKHVSSPSSPSKNLEFENKSIVMIPNKYKTFT